MTLQRVGDAQERDRAGEAVDQRGAVEQHPGREGAQHEIFEARLGGPQVVAVERRDDVEGEAHQLEAEVERDEAAGRDQNQHAHGRQEDQDRELELVDALLAQERNPHDQRAERADQRQGRHEAPEVVFHHGAVEADPEVALVGVADRQQREAENRDGEPRDEFGGPLAPEGTDHEERERPQAHDHLRQDQREGVIDRHPLGSYRLRAAAEAALMGAAWGGRGR